MSNRKLVIDIETIGEDYSSLDEATKDVLTRWIKREAESDAEYEELLEDMKNGLGFSPLTGEIVAIGVLDCEKNEGAVYFQAPDEKNEEFSEEGITFKQFTEKEMLLKFWEGAKHYDCFVTFNGRCFDIPFLMIRSAIYGIRPSQDLMRGRYMYQQNSGSQSIDLADQLTFYGALKKKGGLHLWARAFGIESPKIGGVTGDDVGRLFKEKKYLDIARYNVRDLRATKELFDKWEKNLAF